MLLTRILTAIALLPAILWCLILGPTWSVVLLLSFAVFMSVFEMSYMLQPRLDEVFRNYAYSEARNHLEERRGKGTYIASSRKGHYKVLAAFCALLMNAIFVVVVLHDMKAGSGLVVVGLVLAMLAGVFATRGIEAEMARVVGFIVSMVYAGFPWLVIWDLYSQESGAKALLMTLVIVWMGDTGGYFGGRFFGKRKLSPEKSPKKTWEGAIAGLSASIAGSCIFYFSYYPELIGGLNTGVLVGLFGGIAGQMGDLVESVIKRFTGVKDSGNLLPGHGGLLDRIDGVLFAAPVIWFILYLTKISETLQ